MIIVLRRDVGPVMKIEGTGGVNLSKSKRIWAVREDGGGPKSILGLALRRWIIEN